MSDGPSDCAYASERRANDFVKVHYPTLRRIHAASNAPKQGLVVLVYEEWLQYIVEIITNRQVTRRYVVEPFKGKPRRLSINKVDWPVGYYENHHLPRKGIRRYK